MKSFSNSNRKNVFLTTLATAAAVAAFGVAGTPQATATNLDQNFWIGPTPGNGTSGGNWGTAANWQVNLSINSVNYVGHWVPGSNGNGSYDSSITPSGSGATGGYQDDEYINNGSTLNSTPSGGYNYTANPYTVIVNTNLSANTSYRDLQINSAFNFAGAPQPQSPVTVEVDSGGYLLSGQTAISGGGVDATLAINGGTAYLNGGTSVGQSLNYTSPGQATGYLDVSSGTLYTSNVYAGNQSNGVVNLSGTGVINTNTTPSGGNFYGGVDLGNGSTTVTVNGSPVFYPGVGTMNQTGGTLDIGRTVNVGQSSAGYYNMSGGTINSFDPSRHFWIGTNAAGTLNVSGGTANLANVEVGSDNGNTSNTPNGLLEVSGGTVSMDSLAVGNPDNKGTGTLRITGSGGTIGTTSPRGELNTYANAVLDFQVGSTGVSALQATTGNPTDGRAIVNLSGTLELDLLGGFTPTHGQTFVLVSTDVTAAASDGEAGIVTNAVTYSASNVTSYTNAGLNLDPTDAANWSWAVDPVGPSGSPTGYQLVATYIGQPTIPEPATLGLMAVAGAGLLLIGRRKRA